MMNRYRCSLTWKEREKKKQTYISLNQSNCWRNNLTKSIRIHKHKITQSPQEARVEWGTIKKTVLMRLNSSTGRQAVSQAESFSTASRLYKAAEHISLHLSVISFNLSQLFRSVAVDLKSISSIPKSACRVWFHTVHMHPGTCCRSTPTPSMFTHTLITNYARKLASDKCIAVYVYTWRWYFISVGTIVLASRLSSKNWIINSYMIFLRV